MPSKQNVEVFGVRDFIQFHVWNKMRRFEGAQDSAPLPSPINYSLEWQLRNY
jgi:hypothetical protein